MLSQIKTADDVKKLGTMLSVWAHPDDETFSCGGLLRTAIKNGQTVVCVTATKGEAGVQDESRWPAAQLGAIREEELQAALRILGITNHHWLDYKDGQCAAADKHEAAAKLVPLIKQYQPDTVLTFGPDGITGHTDHIAVGKWAELALTLAGHLASVYHITTSKSQYEAYLKEADEQFNIYFNIDTPVCMPEADCDIAYRLSQEDCRVKRQALAAMPSQMEGMLNHFDEEKFAAAFCIEPFVRAK